MIGYRPAYSAPAFRPPVPAAPAPAMAGPSLGQVDVRIGPFPSLVGAAIGAGVAWTGWTVGTEKSGAQSVVGYVVAVVGALAAIGGGIGFLGGLFR